MEDRADKTLQRAEENRIVRRIVATIVSIFVILGLAVVIGGSLYIKNALKPVDETSTKDVPITVPIGSSVSQIGTILEENDLIRNARVFKYYVKYKNETDFQAGDYVLSPSMEITEIIQRLKHGKVLKETVLKVTIPEGLRLTDIASQIADQTDYTKDDVITLLTDESFIQDLIDRYPILDEDKVINDNIQYALEGYLYPATYSYTEEETDLRSIIDKMVAQMQTVVTAYQGEIKASKYHIHDVLTLASMIEMEAKKSEDRYKISGVFHNRLERGMKLDSDPTVKYAKGDFSIRVLYEDLEVDSPYNTYRYSGLPVGPIASPREKSIKAAILPENIDAMYFYARPNDEVIYSKTLAKHRQVVNKYKSEWEEFYN